MPRFWRSPRTPMCPHKPGSNSVPHSCVNLSAYTRRAPTWRNTTDVSVMRRLVRVPYRRTLSRSHPTRYKFREVWTYVSTNRPQARRVTACSGQLYIRDLGSPRVLSLCTLQPSTCSTAGTQYRTLPPQLRLTSRQTLRHALAHVLRLIGNLQGTPPVYETVAAQRLMCSSMAAMQVGCRVVSGCWSLLRLTVGVQTRRIWTLVLDQPEHVVNP
ncbi:hypothetical protein EXIGLDRAFT_399730 [Exidia glandulosa HHB12029]|uniref:Uncharacterized protein n=1 Tax=Exidia glandulosa HHB12029 TaxID=1314781 RepID=A0A165BLW8_EXIGL|nr:hypothetical protein EXIGLDRAFT_399730 [Exidia glandulosa HHB12029]